MSARTQPTNDNSDLIRGMSRRAVAKTMGMSETTVRAIELKFRMRLAEKIAADPETAKFLRKPSTKLEP